MAQFVLSIEARNQFFREEVAHGQCTTHRKPACGEF